MALLTNILGVPKEDKSSAGVGVQKSLNFSQCPLQVCKFHLFIKVLYFTANNVE